MAFYQDVLNEVAIVVKSVLSLDGPNFRSFQMNQLDWRELIAAGDLELPFVVTHFGAAAPNAEFSGMSNSAWDQKIEIWYVNASASEVESSMESLRDAFVRGGAFTSFQVLEDPSLDTSDSNAANAAFVDGEFPLRAGVLSLKLLASEVAA